MSNHPLAIGILGTGDELIQGDILNTNAQSISRELVFRDIQPGVQLIVADEVHTMARSIQFLLSEHDIVITIGGLGPTCDDVTRDAVALALGLPLEFHPPSWNRLESRFKQNNIVLTENNRQQCCFPKGSEVLVNENGSANGCIAFSCNKVVFMLPGPPIECLPLFKLQVLPKLLSLNVVQKQLRFRGVLIGVSESQVASEVALFLDRHAINVEVGYRCYYPYLDVKFASQNQQELDQLITFLKDQYAGTMVSDTGLIASKVLIRKLLVGSIGLYLDDQVTSEAT